MRFRERTSEGLRFGRIAWVAGLCAAVVLVAAGARMASASPGNLGTNLAGVNYWDGVVPFNDIVRQGGEWIGARPAATDRNGWPTRLTSPVSMAIAELQYPAGRYAVAWRGRGTFRVAGKSFSGRSGRGSVELDGTSLVLLEIRSTSRRDHLRNIQVTVPGARPGSPFRNRYIASLGPYRAIRFMDWQKTNGTFQDPAPRLTCSDATRPGSISQGRRRGAAVYWMIRLANRLDANPWFTVPHTADATWLACHAATVARLLERGLRPRYEFSNETWNPAFEQFHDLTADAVQAGLGGGDAFLGLQRQVARRHLWMTGIVGREMAVRKRPVTRVMAGQAANAWVLEQRLTDAVEVKTDEIAIAPYMHLVGLNAFDPTDGPAITAMDQTALFTNLRGSLAAEISPWISDHLTLAAESGTGLVAYEGGQHLAGDPSNDQMTDLFVGANRNPEMGELYTEYLALWKEATANALFMHFSDSGPYSRFGSWGALESPDHAFADSPKYQALLGFGAGD